MHLVPAYKVIEAMGSFKTSSYTSSYSHYGRTSSAKKREFEPEQGCMPKIMKYVTNAKESGEKYCCVANKTG